MFFLCIERLSIYCSQWNRFACDNHAYRPVLVLNDVFACIEFLHNRNGLVEVPSVAIVEDSGTVSDFGHVVVFLTFYR